MYDVRQNLAPVPVVEQATQSVESSRLETLKRIAASAVSAVTTLPIMAYPVSPEAVRHQAGVALTATKLMSDAVVTSTYGWYAADPGTEEGFKTKVAHPAVGTLAWANLIFGESIALMAQGHLQQVNSSSFASVGAGLATALAVEVGFTTPIALKDRKNKPAQSNEVVAEAMATSFWLGGAMGVENKRLPLKQAPFAIGAYMVFGTMLAGVGEYNNLAEQVIDNKEIVLPALVAWGGLKKMSEFFGYKTATDHVADKTVSLVRRLFGRNGQPDTQTDPDETTVDQPDAPQYIPDTSLATQG